VTAESYSEEESAMVRGAFLKRRLAQNVLWEANTKTGHADNVGSHSPSLCATCWSATHACCLGGSCGGLKDVLVNVGSTQHLRRPVSLARDILGDALQMCILDVRWAGAGRETEGLLWRRMKIPSRAGQRVPISKR